MAAGTPTNSYGKGRNIEELAQMGVADGATANIDLELREEPEESEEEEASTGDDEEDAQQTPILRDTKPYSQPPTWKRYY